MVPLYSGWLNPLSVTEAPMGIPWGAAQTARPVVGVGLVNAVIVVGAVVVFGAGLALVRTQATDLFQLKCRIPAV